MARRTPEAGPGEAAPDTLPAWWAPEGRAKIAPMSPLREDFAGQRQLRFRIHGKQLHLFKQKGESTHHVYLKVLAHAFYRDRADLVFDPKVDAKVQPSLAEVDLTGRICTWVQVGLPPVDKLEYILRHGHADEVCVVLEALAEEDDDADPEERPALQMQALVEKLRKQIHYKYTAKKLKVLMFRPLEEWFDPEDVDPHPAFHVFYSF